MDLQRKHNGKSGSTNIHCPVFILHGHLSLGPGDTKKNQASKSPSS